MADDNTTQKSHAAPRSGRWMPLAAYASRYLPLPTSPLRAGEPLGANRQQIVLHHRHRERWIEMRGIDPETGTRLAIAPDGWALADMALNQLVKPDRWIAYANVKARFLSPAPHSRKSRHTKLLTTLIADIKAIWAAEAATGQKRSGRDALIARLKVPRFNMDSALGAIEDRPRRGRPRNSAT